MNKDIIEGKWKEIKGQLRQQWGKLTDDDIAKMQGTYDELEGLIQKRYGHKKDEIEKEIETFLDEHDWH